MDLFQAGGWGLGGLGLAENKKLDWGGGFGAVYGGGEGGAGGGGWGWGPGAGGWGLGAGGPGAGLGAVYGGREGGAGGWGLGHGCDTPATHANASRTLANACERFANALATIPGQRLDPWTPTFKTGTLLLRIREKELPKCAQ